MKKQLLICALAFLGFSTTLISRVNAYCSQATQTATTNINNTSAVLEWTPINGVDGFNIRFRKMGSSTWEYATAPTPFFVAEGLSPNLTYEYQVQTVCNGTTSAFTEPGKFTTLTHPNIAPVTNAANVVSGFNATISWTSVPGACSYQLQWKTVFSNGWITVNGLTSTSYGLRSLNVCTGYQFRVRTVCPMFSSEYSNVTSFVTNCPTTGTTQIGNRITRQDNEKIVSISLYPNPVHEKLTIEYNSTKGGNITTNVLNMIGKIVMSSSNLVQEGTNSLSFDTSQLAPGIYFIELDNNGEINRSKFMVTN